MALCEYNGKKKSFIKNCTKNMHYLSFYLYFAGDLDSDNGFEDLSKNGPLPSPSATDNTDKDESDFLVSIESQIFPQG